MVSAPGQVISWFACGAFLLPGLTARLNGAEVAGQESFAPFQVIAKGNIFAPERSARSVAAPKPAPAPSDRLVLVGTMSYERGAFAFFDGSSPEYKKALKQGDQVGEFVLAEVGTNQAKLKAGDREFALLVGTCLLRESAGQWRAGGKVDAAPPPLEPAAQSTQSATARTAAEGPKTKDFVPADPDKEERKAEKKLVKYLAGLDPAIKKDKQRDRDPNTDFADAPRKHDKSPKHAKD
jgi:hypothetical protein